MFWVFLPLMISLLILNENNEKFTFSCSFVLLLDWNTCLKTYTFQLFTFFCCFELLLHWNSSCMQNCFLLFLCSFEVFFSFITTFSVQIAYKSPLSKVFWLFTLKKKLSKELLLHFLLISLQNNGFNTECLKTIFFTFSCSFEFLYIVNETLYYFGYLKSFFRNVFNTKWLKTISFHFFLNFWVF